MSRVVADASLCGAWILPDEASGRADALLESVLSGDAELVLPALWRYEMVNLLRSAVRRGRLTAEAAAEAVQLLGRLPEAQFDVPDAEAAGALLRLAAATGLSAYDAAYLELAKRLKIPLATADEALAKAAADTGVALLL